MASYFTGIMLLPVLYMLFYRIGIRKHNWFTANFKNLLKNEWLTKFYDAGIEWVFSHRKINFALALFSLPLCVFMFWIIVKERMPKIDQNETESVSNGMKTFMWKRTTEESMLYRP